MNTWIDVPKQRLRVAQRILALCVFLVGLAATLAVTSILSDPTPIVVTQIIGGVAIAFVSIGISTLLERAASRGEASRLDSVAKATLAARYDAFLRGESPDPQL